MGVGHTWIMNPTLINTFRWGLTRQSLDFSGAVTGPGFQMRDFSNIQDFDNRNMGRILPTHNITDDVTWVRQRHTLQFGVNYRNIHNKQSAESGTYPYYKANDAVMIRSGRDVLPPGIATSFRTQYIRAQMALLGTISQVDVNYYYDQNGNLLPEPHVPRREFINGEFEWYVQDQWKVNRRLTLDIGLRMYKWGPFLNGGGEASEFSFERFDPKVAGRPDLLKRLGLQAQ
jgi:outer membrane receptor protein involved in Fe transport